MIGHSYLIFSPAEPTDVSAAAMQQRQTIPLAWAFAAASKSSELVRDKGHTYYKTRVADALTMLDRGLSAWRYNSYLSDTLAPIGVFRTWLANYAPDTWMYLNFSELLLNSPSPDEDVAELRRLPEKVMIAFEEIEDKNFTNFLQELRKLSYPLITVPITGDRKIDMQILRYEIRDTSSMEDEMALQMVGVDRDKSMLRSAVESIRLRRDDKRIEDDRFTGDPEPVTLFASDFAAARRLLSEALELETTHVDGNRVEFRVGDQTVVLVAITESQLKEARS